MSNVVTLSGCVVPTNIATPEDYRKAFEQMQLIAQAIYDHIEGIPSAVDADNAIFDLLGHIEAADKAVNDWIER